jgi:hypothetical protein
MGQGVDPTDTDAHEWAPGGTGNEVYYQGYPHKPQFRGFGFGKDEESLFAPFPGRYDEGYETPHRLKPNPDAEGWDFGTPKQGGHWLPWQPGEFGKGFVTPMGGVVHWRTDGPDGWPGHREGLVQTGYSHHMYAVPLGMGPQASDFFEVAPDGYVVPSRLQTPEGYQRIVNSNPSFTDQPPEQVNPVQRVIRQQMAEHPEHDWSGYIKQFPDEAQYLRTAAEDPRIVYHDEIDPTNLLGNASGYWGRWPTIYLPETGELHVGPEGSTHEQVADTWGAYGGDYKGMPYQGWIGTNPEWDSGLKPVERKIGDTQVGWYNGSPGPHIDYALATRSWPQHLDSDIESDDQGYGHGPHLTALRTAATSWHLTDNPHFALDPSYVPHDNTFALQERTQPGLYVGDPEKWFNGYDYVRPYAAEIEHPDAEQGRWGGEGFIPGEQLGQSQVKRVIPLDEYARETYGEPGWFEEHENPQAWDSPRTKYPNYRYEGPDVRTFTPEEHQRHQERADRYIRETRPHMLTRYDEYGDPVEYGDPRWDKYAALPEQGPHRLPTNMRMQVVYPQSWYHPYRGTQEEPWNDEHRANMATERTPFWIGQHQADNDDHRIFLGYPGSYHDMNMIPDDYHYVASGAIKPSGYGELGGPTYHEPSVQLFNVWPPIKVWHPRDEYDEPPEGLENDPNEIAGRDYSDRLWDTASRTVQSEFPELGWRPRTTNVHDSGYFTGTVNKAAGVNNLTEIPSPWGAGRCPSCGGPHVDEDSGECTDCGKTIPYDGAEQLMGYDFTPPELLAEQPHGFMQWDTSGLGPYHGNSGTSERITVESNMWDPLTCEYCGGPMSEPRQVPKAWGAGSEWINSCTRCHRTRAVPANYPLLRQQQESYPAYPQALQEVGGNDRPWVFAAQEFPATADNQRVSWSPFKYNPQLPSHEEMAQGKMCRFHPDRPAVIAVGFAPMCEDCKRSYQQAAQRVQAPQWVPLTASERLAETDSTPWEGHAWHTNSQPFSTPVRTPYWTTLDEEEAKASGDTVHPVQVRFKRPAHFFGELPDGWDELTRHNDGIVVHRPSGAWAIALDPGTVVPGHLKNPLE